MSATDQWPETVAEQKKQWFEAKTGLEQAQSRIKAMEAENQRLREANGDLRDEQAKIRKEHEQ